MPQRTQASQVTASLEEKRAALFAHLRSLGRLMVAYSGGVDSALLAYAAHRILGDQMLAVIADSPSLSRAHLRDAVEFADSQGIPLKVIATNELEDAEYVRNDGSRCFHCKDELFKVMSRVGVPLGFSAVAYGKNVDDIGEFRPGQTAAAHHNVIAPLAEAGLTKGEVRGLARLEGLRIWDKPASACLSSRIAYGLPVTRQTLEMIEKGEDILFEMGFRQFRVRHHGELVRIEIAREEMDRILSLTIFAKVTAALKRLGYQYVTLDLEGYRSGSMNALLLISQIGLNGSQGSATVEAAK